MDAPGKYSPKPSRIAFSWRRDGKVIARAKGASYTLKRDDVGHRIQVHVLVRRKHYQPETVVRSELGHRRGDRRATVGEGRADLVMGETVDESHMFTQEFWDERYAASDRVWSGRPNPRLVEHAADLTPGMAIDVGLR